MVDLRTALRPLVEQPTRSRPAVAEIAARAEQRQRRTRRRRRSVVGTGLVGLAAAAVVAVTGLVTPHDRDAGVSTGGVPPSAADGPQQPGPDGPAPAPDQPEPSPPPTTTTSDPAPTPDTTATPPAPARPTGDDPVATDPAVRATATTTSAWDRGHCVQVRVENTSEATVEWAVRYDPAGTLATLWNAVVDDQVFVGEDWNRRLAPGAWTTFGLCLDTP